MAKIPNPNQGKEFERISNDANGNPEYGYRIVDDEEEIVHIPSGRSNMAYHTPRMVLDPSNCKHEFVFTASREVECKCGLGLTFNAATDFFEEDGKSFIILRKKKYPVN